MVKVLTQSAFEAFPQVPRPAIRDFIIEEHEWYSDDAESALGVVVHDVSDKDWGYVVLQPDSDSVFRAVSTGHSFPQIDEARERLLAELDHPAGFVGSA